MLMLTILSAILGAFAAALAGAAFPGTLLAYSVSGTIGLLALATWKVLRVADLETTPGHTGT